MFKITFYMLVIANCMIFPVFATEKVKSTHSAPPQTQKMVAFTFDDVPHAGGGGSILEMTSSNKQLLTTLKQNNVPAIGFVNEKLIFDYPQQVKARTAILEMWLNQGFELGNHTYSHWSLMDVPLETYEPDVLKNETITKPLMAKHNMNLKYFRHPFLVTGRTLDDKNQFEKFLHKNGYTIAPVTMEFLDWKFNLIYVYAKEQNDSETLNRVVKEYLEFANQKIAFYEKISQEILGYQARQILLLHDNELNADHIKDIIQLFKSNNYQFINIEKALKDKAYSLPDNYFGPIGGSWFIHWDKREGKESHKIDWSTEPKPSQFIVDQFDAITNKTKTESNHYENSK